VQLADATMFTFSSTSRNFSLDPINPESDIVHLAELICFVSLTLHTQSGPDDGAREIPLS
jgi:hypothetical protein